jgi:hypothetical protein
LLFLYIVKFPYSLPFACLAQRPYYEHRTLPATEMDFWRHAWKIFQDKVRKFVIREDWSCKKYIREDLKWWWVSDLITSLHCHWQVSRLVHPSQIECLCSGLKQWVSLKYWCLCTKQRDFTSQKTVMFINIAVRTLNVISYVCENSALQATEGVRACVWHCICRY